MGDLFKGLFKPKTQEPQKAAPMPDELAADVIESRRKASQDALKRKGRGSTIMSGGDFGTYGGSDLGTA